MPLSPKETQLVGEWIKVNDKVIGDETCQRIVSLIRDQLEKISTDYSGWDVLYKDPVDGRLWELIYPQGWMHGGGPPTLTCLSLEKAREKYGNIKLY